MTKSPANNSPRWKKIPAADRRRAETFLREREKLCVAACARFLHIEESRGHVWRLDEQGGAQGGLPGGISALLIHSHRSLFPVFDKNPRVPGPRFLSRFLGKVPIHALQGLKEDVELLERLMEGQGYFSSERIDYELMGLDSAPRGTISAGNQAGLPAGRLAGMGAPGLVIRPPLPRDTEDLFALQAAYEQEEVLPANAVFNPASSRLNLRQILSREHVFVAEIDGQVVGKINTSAESFTRYQIGGVYVRPDCRGSGIGKKMTSAFVQNILAQGKGLTLFVKKRNAAAKAVYRGVGFSVLADYRISYY